jgi:two-component system, cell cycle sensor histidine kinase and response regulator CckA
MRKDSVQFLLFIALMAGVFWTLDALWYSFNYPQFSLLGSLLGKIPKPEVYERLFLITGLSAALWVTLKVIHRHRETRTALWEGQRLLDSVLNSIEDGLLIKDLEGTIIRANPTFERDFSPAMPVVGKKCYEVMRNRTEPCEDCPCRQTIDKGEPVHRIQEKVRGRGWVEISSYPLEDQTSGKVAGIIELTRDITLQKEAEAALRESEEKYRLLVNNIPAVVFKGYTDGNIDFIDDKIKDLTGYDKEEFHSRRLRWLDLILPEDLDGVRQAFIQALKTTKSYVREYRIRHKDGGILWIQAQGQIICDAQSRVDYVSGVFFDITAHRQAEDALKQSETSLAEAQRLAHLGNWEWDVPANKSIWSDEVYRIFGITPQEFEATHEAFLACVHPGDRAAVKQAVKEALNGRNSYSISYRVILPDGSPRYVYANARLDVDDRGQPLRLVGTVQDLTALKQAQEALEESERRYRLLAENLTDVIFTTDLNLRLTYISPSVRFFTGYSPEEVLGRKLEQILTPASAELAAKTYAEELAREQDQPGQTRSRVLEFEHYCKDGRTIWGEVRANLLRDAQGQAIGVIGVTRDITARRDLEEQLRQAQKMEVVGRLAGGVAHDFNNLLTAILGYAALLLNSMDPGAPYRHDIEEIRKAGERAALLTRQLMAFSRRQVLHPIALDLNQVVDNLGKMTKRVIGEDIDLEIVPGPDLGMVMADPGQIEQVILNLAINARDAMPHGGRLSIRTSNTYLDQDYVLGHADQMQPGPFVLLEVEDTGCGMDTATRSHIFEPFYTTKELGKGTGLGLSTVYGIISQSGGNISVSSEPGRGTAFKIYLPRSDALAGAGTAAEAAMPALQGQETILLVEDENLVRAITRRILGRLGYRVMEARDGREALEISAKHEGPIHLLLTDLVMPGMSGQELADRLASGQQHLKVLFMSGYAENSLAGGHELAKPGRGYIQKPFEAQSLAAKVRELLKPA